MLISGASFYIQYMFYRLTHALYYRKQKNTFYIWETTYYCLEKNNYDFVVI